MSEIENIRHSLAHILAHAAQDIYPGTKFGIGPVIEDGFYYDLDLPKDFSSEELPKIEREMKKLIGKNLKFKDKKISKKKAKKLFKDQPYKLELIEELSGDKVSVYESGDFVDLCKGGHVESTKEINKDGFKLMRVAGAYWRGDEKNKMLTRIYGVAFESKKKLDDYLERLEKAKDRDHRVLGKKLNLFTFSEVVGKGLPLWTEKGATLKRVLERFVIDEEIKRGYKHVYTPNLANVRLFEKSGHYPYYSESMYPPIEIDDEKYMLRPMTCPHHFELYLSKPRSYKELPMRIAEIAKLFRYEQSGELSGLLRVREFCLADAHIICADEKQAKEEIHGALDLIEFMSQKLNLEMGKDYWYRLSLGKREDEKKYFKDDASWDKSEKVLKEVLKERKSEFVTAEDEAAFYGPKIDIQMKNVMGKEDTAFTVQYDFVMPKRFNLTYTDRDDKEKETLVVHRSSIGAIERSIAFLIEHYGGAFPFWLSPEQIWIIPVGEDHLDYAKEVKKELKECRVKLKSESETVSKKIREGEVQKIPYVLVVGENEIKNKSVSVRSREEGDIGEMSLDKFLSKIKGRQS